MIKVKAVDLPPVLGVHTIKVPAGSELVEVRVNTRHGGAHVVVLCDHEEAEEKEMNILLIGEGDGFEQRHDYGLSSLQPCGSFQFPNGDRIHAFRVHGAAVEAPVTGGEGTGGEGTGGG